MQYLGGKSKWGRAIVDKIEPWRTPGDLFVDVFCGALNVVRHASGQRLALDLCLPLVTLLQASQRGWVPPDRITEEQYRWIKAHPDPLHPLTAFAMFGCSYGGQWGGTFARAHDPKNSCSRLGFAPTAARSLARKMADCRDVEILWRDYRTLPDPYPGLVLYCDPPYEGTSGYAGVPPFDSTEFWRHASWWHHKGALVFVSEGVNANPPPDWIIYHHFNVKAALSPGRLNSTVREERIYVHRHSPMAVRAEGP